VQITSAQIRAARALLNLSGRQLSERSGISPSTLHRAENAEGKPNMHASTLIAIEAALEALGVEFLDDTGVRLVRTSIETWVMRKDSFV
jgi:transcriptional regulator with XRE-family HTH domain